MLYTWVPQLDRHIKKQVIKSWLYFLTAVAIVVLLPYILHPLLSDIVTADELSVWMHAHLGFIAFSLVAILILYELQIYQHYRKIWRAHEQHGVAIMERLASKALLRHTPRTLLCPKTEMNVAAMTSLFGGHFVAFYGKSSELLNEREKEAVIGHEIAHLKHGDRASALILLSMGIVLNAYCFALFAASLSAAAFDFNIEQGVALLRALWVACVLRVLLGYIKCAHSRTREYLADAGGIALTGWDFRDDLIRALKKIDDHHAGRWPRQLSFVWPEFLRTHPRIANRARVLGLDASKIAY